MGYTHYVSRPMNNAGSAYMFGKLGLDVKAICDYAQENGIALGDAFGAPNTQPVCTEGYFAFNGVSDENGDNGHESFWWDAIPTQPEWRKDEPDHFSFCKTAYKPYDAVVTASLIRAKVIYGSCIRVSSDGSWDEWKAGREMYEAVFGEIAPNPMSE
jgi:hypothetical protein